MHVGSHETEEAAVETSDLLVLNQRGGRELPNRLQRRLEQSDVNAAPSNTRRPFGRAKTSRYLGVHRSGLRWTAKLRIDGRDECLGYWDSEVEAAEAYDRAARFSGGDGVYLNFPWRATGGLAPAEIRRRARLAFKRKTTSRYRGVSRQAGVRSRPWWAHIIVEGRTMKHLGKWASEEDAARAVDRAARFYLGQGVKLNFPGRWLRPSSAATLVAESRRKAKVGCSSPYRGVSWDQHARMWQASVSQGDRKIKVGRFASERTAAEAYDEKAIELLGSKARVNFHPKTGEPVWGKSLDELAAEE